MQCPYCQTENREDRETCYACDKDISTIRLVVNKARQHYNDALEHAERGRVTEAIEELKNAIDLDWSLQNAHVVLGTLYARDGKFAEARQSWQNALALNPELERAHDYLERVDSVQAALPTLRLYRWIALALLIISVALAAVVITRMRPPRGEASLKQANTLLTENKYGDAAAMLEQARTLAEPDGTVETAARALDQSLKLDMDQQIRTIQDLKYRQMYPEALSAIAQLESVTPDMATSSALTTIRADINYYYHNLISQLYTAYAQGDVDFDTLHQEITRFINLYPDLPEQDEIRSYLDKAERMEAQAAIDELRRRFTLDNNVEVAVQGLQELDKQMGEISSFQSERSVFIEEILSDLFNLFTGYLDQDDFVRAAALLNDIDRVTTEFRDVVEVDISGAVDLAYSVMRDARRQYLMSQIEKLINDNKPEAAQEAIWDIVQEPDLSPAELKVIQSYWRKLHRGDRLAKFYKSIKSDSRFFDLHISDRQASRTIKLFNEFSDGRIPQTDKIYLTGLTAAAAMKLGDDDMATSLAKTLRQMDKNSTVTRAVETMLTPKPLPVPEPPAEEKEEKSKKEPTPQETQPEPEKPGIKIEPADKPDQ